MNMKKKNTTHTRGLKWGWFVLLIGLLALPYWLHHQPEMPSGTNAVIEGAYDEMQLLIDDTSFDINSGDRVIRQEIFDSMLALIQQADAFIYVDFFLWNTWQGAIPEDHRGLAEELAEALIARKRADPTLPVLVQSDPINRIYGTHEEAFYSSMSDAGIVVVFTDLDKLPDSNSIYAPPARMVVAWVKKWPRLYAWLQKARFANPLDLQGPRISAAQLGRLVLFKANHRKVLITGRSDKTVQMIVASMNPADGSSAHSNIGLFFSGELAVQALLGDLKTVQWSADNPHSVLAGSDTWSRPGEVITQITSQAKQALEAYQSNAMSNRAVILGEHAIHDRICSMLTSAGKGDHVRIALFYLSDREIIQCIKQAALNGASVRLLLDPNKDAFGREKNGIPNRPVAAELMQFSVREHVDLLLRWIDTHGEQFHTKAMSIVHADGSTEFICGSANWTRRNLKSFNMELNAYIEDQTEVNEDFDVYFDTVWGNTDGLHHSVDFSHYEENGSECMGKKMGSTGCRKYLEHVRFESCFSVIMTVLFSKMKRSVEETKKEKINKTLYFYVNRCNKQSGEADPFQLFLLSLKLKREIGYSIKQAYLMLF